MMNGTIPQSEQHVQDELRRHLDTGERLIWAGQPKQGVRFQLVDLFLVPFSVLWVSVPVSMLYAFLTGPDEVPLFFALWVLPFLLVGAYVTVGRFWWDARRRARTSYGLTERRIVLISGVVWREVRSVNLRTLSDLSVVERASGYGDVALGPRPWFANLFAGSGWPGMNAGGTAFENVHGARRVYDLIRQAQERLSPEMR